VVVTITHGLVAELELTSIFLGHVDRHGIHHVTCFNHPLSEDRTRIASKYTVLSAVAPHLATQIRNIPERAHPISATSPHQTKLNPGINSAALLDDELFF
jgi:hypothetical protein